jgi:uncharacterized protein YeaO (DUF488 family)
MSRQALQVIAPEQGAYRSDVTPWKRKSGGRPVDYAISPENIRLKRAYEPPAAGDGTRILVDRLWPRGVKKATAAIDMWAKDIAPSTELRQWFGHETNRWEEFRRRYVAELEQKSDLINKLRSLGGVDGVG